MLDQKEYIRNQIAKASKNRTVTAQALPAIITIPPAERPKFLSQFFLVCVVLMCLAIPGLIVFKDYSTEIRQFFAAKETPNLPPQMISLPPQIISQNYMTQSDADKLTGRVNGIEKSLKEANDKIWLLGVTQSENIQMNSALTKKYFPQEPSDYMILNGDWKINRMPRHLTFEDKHKEKLQEFVK